MGARAAGPRGRLLGRRQAPRVGRVSRVGHGLSNEVYAAQGRPRIQAPAVHLYELCLLGRWYREALEGEGDGGPPDQLLRQLENVLRRARAASSSPPRRAVTPA